MGEHKVEDSTSQKFTGEQSIPVRAGGLISVLDKDLDGQISMTELRRNVRQLHFMRKLTVLLVVVVIFLIIGMLGAAYAAMETAKEIKAREGKLVDSKSQGVSTRQSIMNIGSVSGGRRLQLLQGAAYQFNPPVSVCSQIWNGYTQLGAIHVAVDISSITFVLNLLGGAHVASIEAAFNDPSVGKYLSGRISTCVASTFWVAFFNSSGCVVTADLSILSGLRRLNESTSSEGSEPEAATKDLLSRASLHFEKEVQTSLETSLGGEGRGLLVDKCLISLGGSLGGGLGGLLR
mmetsp:Transcript_71167/g.154682  ORF Transcript_71167/g.154682 Transcript_71167/m.154682 type:complete len:291 (+) Transcript_71167:143-1015(+)